MVSKFQKALITRETVLGEEHPDTATTYNDIAFVYDSKGEYDKALEWFQKALIIRETILGKEHPDTANTYNNIVSMKAGNCDTYVLLLTSVALSLFDPANPVKTEYINLGSGLPTEEFYHVQQ